MVQVNHFRPIFKKGWCILVLCYTGLSGILGQSPIGTWVTVDDQREVNIAHVQIFQQGDMLYGKVLKLLPDARNRSCQGCKDQDKGRTIEGMTLIRNMTSTDGKYWDHGKLFDPNSGREFDCAMWLDTADVLKVRVSLGWSIFGRTQTWIRLKN